MPTAEALSLVDICLRRKSRQLQSWALKNVSLTVASGEVVGVVGLSREGRTGLLRTAAGLEAPDSGRVELAEVDLTKLSRSKREGRLRNRVLWSSLMFDERKQVDHYVGTYLLAGGLTWQEATHRLAARHRLGLGACRA